MIFGSVVTNERAQGRTVSLQRGGCLVAAAMLFFAVGCSHDMAAPTFQPFALECSTVGGGGPNKVSMQCPTNANTLLRVDVVLGGPTTSRDIYGVKFDLVFDPNVLQFAPPAVQGSFLSQNGAATLLQSSAHHGRLVVVVSRQGAVSGIQGTDAQTTIVGLMFAGVAAGVTDVSFENGELVDSTLTAIAGIDFLQPLSIAVK